MRLLTPFALLAVLVLGLGLGIGLGLSEAPSQPEPAAHIAVPPPTGSPTTSIPRSSPSIKPPPFRPAVTWESFVSPTAGWVLLHKSPCSSSACFDLLQTTDGGVTWTPETVPPLPDVSSAEITFVDPQDGWAYYNAEYSVTNGGPFFATHNGGRTWVAAVAGSLSEGVQAVGAADGTAWAVALSRGAGTYSIFSSPESEDAWTASALTLPLGAGPMPEISMVLEDDRGWVVENDRAAATLADGMWADWSTPCAPEQGYGIATLASTTTQLFVLCATNEFTSIESPPTVFVSTDGGTTFQPLSGSFPSSFLGFTVSPSGTLFCFDIRGIAASFDGGSSWQTVFGQAKPPDGWPTLLPQLEFPSALVGYATMPAGDLVKTEDGGQTWLVVPIPMCE